VPVHCLLLQQQKLLQLLQQQKLLQLLLALPELYGAAAAPRDVLHHVPVHCLQQQQLKLLLLQLVLPELYAAHRNKFTAICIPNAVVNAI
jgi:hypothetical protein